MYQRDNVFEAMFDHSPTDASIVQNGPTMAPPLNQHSKHLLFLVHTSGSVAHFFLPRRLTGDSFSWNVFVGNFEKVCMITCRPSAIGSVHSQSCKQSIQNHKKLSMLISTSEKQAAKKSLQEAILQNGIIPSNMFEKIKTIVTTNTNANNMRLQYGEAPHKRNQNRYRLLT